MATVSKRTYLKFLTQELFIYCFVETGKLILKFVWGCRRDCIGKLKVILEKRNRVGRFIFPNFITSYSPVELTPGSWSLAHGPDTGTRQLSFDISTIVGTLEYGDSISFNH